MTHLEVSNPTPHTPVLYKEIIHSLQPRGDGRYIDGTLGAGGHARGILAASEPNGRLLGLDVDPVALAIARERLAPYDDRAILVQASYTEMAEQAARVGWQAVEGVVLDLGVSSMQIDAPERGFSFLADAPLDMRFDPENPVTAAQLVNTLPEKDLADLIFRYGEERQSRQIARAIVQNRPLESTRQLAQLIGRVISKGRSTEGRIDPATRTFQALRIAVNHELESLEAALPLAVSILAPGGRLAVISFHSLEDRIVKQYMQIESQDCICPPRQPVCTCGHHATLKVITRHPVRPSEAETQVNPRARSARLRVAERLPADMA